MVAWRDIKVKYKQSAMGFLWAILMPVIIVSAGIVVRYAISTISGKPITSSEVIIVSIKAVPWAFCVASIRFATNSLVANPNLVTKIYFPKEIFPLAAVISSGFDFLIAGSLLTVVLIIIHVSSTIYLLWVPLLLLIMIMLVTGLGMVLAALNLFFRDIKYLVEVVLTFAIFFTPVLYDAKMFGRFSNVLLLNPLAPLLEGLSACVVLHQSPSVQWVAYSAAISVCMLLIGYSIFKNLEFRFAESI